MTSQKENELINIFDKKDQQEVADAIAFAKQAHKNQKRKSGEDFFTHPLEVSLILAQQGLSKETCIAGLLHDTLEDTEVEEKDIKEFGEEIFHLVDGVTKIDQLAPKGSKKRADILTYRKLILAASSDARILLIKLADRLHNMRTLQHLSQQKRLKISEETLQVYAPLAHRLGISQVKEELEERALFYLDPRLYSEAQKIQKERQAKEEELINDIKKKIEDKLQKENIKAEIKWRTKSKFSIAEKLKRGTEKIWDINGIRIICTSKEDCYRILGIIHSSWKIRFDRFKDFISVPKSNLYQSLHTTIIDEKGRFVEIQIRTEEMNEIAEYGIAAHWHYKETLRQGGPKQTQRYLSKTAENQNNASLEESFQALKQDVFRDEVYVFTPEGEIRILPLYSTPVDFAYTVHSELGNRCKGARIDGKLVPLDTRLKNGVRVEVITGKEDNPSLSWLEFVQTARARHEIRSFHNPEGEKEIKEGYRKIGEALKRNHLGPLAEQSELQKKLKEAAYKPDDAAKEAWRDSKRIKVIVDRIIKILPEDKVVEEEQQEKGKKESRKFKESDNKIEVDGEFSIKTILAGCCHPEPGDQILAYVSLVHGAKIHKKDCKNIILLKKKTPARVLKARWNDNNSLFHTRLQVAFLDEPKLLHSIGEAIYSEGAELIKIELNTNKHVVRGEVTCLVSSKEQSDNIKLSLETMPEAISVKKE